MVWFFYIVIKVLKMALFAGCFNANCLHLAKSYLF